MRPYIREMDEVRARVPGFAMVRWPQAIDIVTREKPDVVIMASNPRNLTCWKLPAACRSVGSVIVSHTKVHSVSGVPPFIMKLVKRNFYKRMDLAICYGEQSKREIVALGFPAEKARVAQNTIDTRRIFEQTDSIRARGDELRRAAKLRDKKILLCIGRMEADKRHADLLQAWGRLRDIDPSLVMVLVSGGPLLEQIKSQARSIDPNRIVVTGRVAEGDDYAWIAAADLTIYPGAVGLAINQSLALGKPTVIADEYGADAEILEHDVTGWRYPRGDIDAMIAAVRNVLDDEPARGRVSDNARTLMRERVTIDNMADNFHATILEAIALGKARKK
jgi:glycosyltransferase involved in cell wall biosynthesis